MTDPMPFEVPAEIVARVRDCVARVTRYPLEVLTPEASLEDELGIDSVKLAEIAAVLGEELNLAAGSPPHGRNAATILDLARYVHGLMQARAAVPSPALAAAIAPAALPSPAIPSPAPHRSPPPAALAERVCEVIARVTRYPREVLTLEADIEDELGIDSVKQAEIAAVLGLELGLASLPIKQASVRTIGELVAAVAAALAPPLAALSVESVVAVPRLAGPREPRGQQPGSSHERATPHPLPALPFAGKITLVTGSGRGIGKTIALHLARQGATVVVNSFHSREAGEETAREIVQAGGRALHLWGSVAQPEHLDAIFGQLERELGGLDFLVCNASDGFIGPFESIEPKHWDRAFRTNITGTYECAMRAAPLMKARGGGAIVTMGTITSQRYLEGFGCQGVVKAAVESLTRYLAFELAAQGIRANCIAAGPVYGDLINKFPNARELIARWESMTPGGQLCAAEDVAAVTEFLLSSAASRITGAIWTVDNGASGQVDGRVRPLARRPAMQVVAPSPLVAG